MNKKKKSHIEARLICPECSAVIITPRPEVLIWERCPGCGSHVWDAYDLLMAEIVPASPTHDAKVGMVMRTQIN